MKTHNPPRNIASTVLRRFRGDNGHQPPMSGLDNAGQPWKGTSRIVDKADRKRANVKSWRKVRADARRGR